MTEPSTAAVHMGWTLRRRHTMSKRRPTRTCGPPIRPRVAFRLTQSSPASRPHRRTTSQRSPNRQQQLAPLSMGRSRCQLCWRVQGQSSQQCRRRPDLLRIRWRQWQHPHSVRVRVRVRVRVPVRVRAPPTPPPTLPTTLPSTPPPTLPPTPPPPPLPPPQPPPLPPPPP